MTNEQRVSALFLAEQAVLTTLTWLRSLHPMPSRSERIKMLEKAAAGLTDLVHEAQAALELDAVVEAEEMLCKEPYCGNTATREDGLCEHCGSLERGSNPIRSAP